MHVDRVVRVFISSTFRDFERERDLLMRQVFPELRRRSADRGLEVVGIDLRWGITQEQAERGETLPICLAEIDRCRPYFLGLMGERYGWTPGPGAYNEAILAAHPWLKEHRDGTSVTELEIVHGAINQADMRARAAFLLRAPAWSEANGFGPVDERERAQVAGLRARILRAGHTFIEYDNPDAVADKALDWLWSAIGREFPISDAPDPAEEESRTHLAFAASRTRLFVGRERQVSQLAAVGAVPGGGVLVTSQSGFGKSSILAKAASQCAAMGDLVFEHYPGASGPAASLHALLSRLHSWIDRTLGQGVAMASRSDPRDDAMLAAELPARLASLNDSLDRAQRRAVLVIDGLDRLAWEWHLPWLPESFPPRVRVLMASSDPRHCEPVTRLGFDILELGPLEPAEARDLLRSILEHHRKRLPSEYEAALLGHSLSAAPVFLATVVGELCVSATHHSLAERVRKACAALTVADSIRHVIERVAEDLPGVPVTGCISAIRCSRDGLTEQELRGICALTPSGWAQVRTACEGLLHESDGRIRLRHSHVECACDAACMQSDAARRARHSALADWWLSQGPSARAVFDMPWQLVGAGRTDDLRRVLADAGWMAMMLGFCPETELLRALNCAGMETPEEISRELAEHWSRWSEGLDDATRGSFAQALGGFVGFVTHGSAFAVQLLMESVASSRRDGSDSSALAIRLNNLGHELLAARKPTAATEAFAECLDIRERILAPEHPHLMATLDNLGQAYAAAGELMRGIRMLRDALERRRKALGDAHPETSTSKNNLAMLLIAANQADEAGKLLEESYRDTRARLGPNHPDSGIAAGNLGKWHASHGDPACARTLLTEAVDVHRRCLGSSHPYVAVGLSRLADLDAMAAKRVQRSRKPDEGTPA